MDNNGNVQPEEFSRAPKEVSFDAPYPEVPACVKGLAQPGAMDNGEEWVAIDDIELLDKKALIIRLHGLESFLKKGEARRGAAEKMAREALSYADSVKSMVSERINFIRQTMQESINKLKLEHREYKTQSEKELLTYREQLDLANKQLGLAIK